MLLIRAIRKHSLYTLPTILFKSPLPTPRLRPQARSEAKAGGGGGGLGDWWFSGKKTKKQQEDGLGQQQGTTEAFDLSEIPSTLSSRGIHLSELSSDGGGFSARNLKSELEEEEENASPASHIQQPRRRPTIEEIEAMTDEAEKHPSPKKKTTQNVMMVSPIPLHSTEESTFVDKTRSYPSSTHQTTTTLDGKRRLTVEDIERLVHEAEFHGNSIEQKPTGIRKETVRMHRASSAAPTSSAAQNSPSVKDVFLTLPFDKDTSTTEEQHTPGQVWLSIVVLTGIIMYMLEKHSQGDASARQTGGMAILLLFLVALLV